MDEIYPIKKDFMFKKILGDTEEPTEELVISEMLSVFIDIPKNEFSEIAFLPTELLPEQRKGKKCILDMLIKTKSEYHINVEVQVAEAINILKRILYYGARLAADQVNKGDDYILFNRTITIFILDFKLLDDAQFFHTFRYYDEKNRIELTNLMEIVIIELPKIPSEQPKGKNLALWAWAYLFKAETAEEFNMLQKTEVAGIEKAVGRMVRFSATEEAKHYAELERMAEMDHKMFMETARVKGEAEGKAKGLAEGKAEGKAEGRAEGKTEVAINLFKKGLNISLIAETTGFSIEELEKLKASI
jgi:predicted transposase/invertase (TIGR01784 family)